MSSEQTIRDRVAQNDVTMARSYLEVDVMEWLSENRIPFGYEPFTIPSVVGPNNYMWDGVVEGVRAIGNRNFDRFDDVKSRLSHDVRLTTGDSVSFDSMRAGEVMAMWEDIYDKHRLQSENVVVEVRRSLSGFDKKLMLPDFVLYYSNVNGVEEVRDGVVAEDGFDWSDWDSIVEVSGLWGVGLPGEAGESDWWSWYRVSAVAFKELAYRLLGLWDDVYWVIPNQTYIEGVSDGIPRGIREDEHYIIINTTASDLQLGELASRAGFSAEVTRSGLSPQIELIEYERVPAGDMPAGLEPVEWTFDGIDMANVDQNKNAVIVGEDYVVFHGDLGEVYVTNEGVHVRETQWRTTNMVLLREYVVDVMSQLAEDGIVVGLRRA